jgi:hypothetical protein
MRALKLFLCDTMCTFDPEKHRKLAKQVLARTPAVALKSPPCLMKLLVGGGVAGLNDRFMPF